VSYDARITPLRDGIASAALEGLMSAEVYLEPRTWICAVPATAIRRAPTAGAEQVDQLLFGEAFDVIEEDEGGFVWGQAPRDGYVGFVEAASLVAPGLAPTHRIAALRTYAFAENSIKTRAHGPFSMNALVHVEADEGRLCKVAGSGWVTARHLTPIGECESDHAAVAERFLGAPYLWGGRESLGLDCSGLVQQALFACGRTCPRDADQQETLGHEIARADVRRGDLVFWVGHVAIALDADRIVHANGFHMMVEIERLDDAVTRISAAGNGAPTSYRRIT
jgi:cell wall-associated NlpC family hydrolase